METYELEFPLKHAKYVIPDVEYEIHRNRIMGYNTPFISFFRRCEKFFILLFSGKGSELLTKINNKTIKRRGKNTRVES